MQQAIELLHDGRSIKETSAYLGYRDASHFSHEFKKFHGFPPQMNKKQPAKTAATLKMSHLAMNLQFPLPLEMITWTEHRDVDVSHGNPRTERAGASSLLSKKQLEVALKI